jgi:hypothetical protein
MSVAVVLGDGSTGRLWQAAVVRRGAIGVISPSMAAYVRPGSTAADAARPRAEWDVLQWGSIPYDEALKETLSLPVAGPSDSLKRLVERAVTKLHGA